MIEKAIIAEIAKANKIKIATLGLRFDRVVNRLIDDLHDFGEKTLPTGTTVLVAITAPIRVPAQTAAELRSRIESLAVGASRPRDKNVTINGNNVRIRILRHSDRHQSY
jgi:hypothetical protein